MRVLLHIPLENARASGLVEASGLEDVRSVDPVVVAAAHDVFLEVGAELELVDGNLDSQSARHGQGGVRGRTPL